MTERDLTLPPHNVANEQSVLGSVLKSDRVMAQIADLQPEDFYQPKHRQVFAAMRSLFNESIPIDFTTLHDRLIQRHPEQPENWVLLMSDLTAATPTAAHAAHYADLVRRDAASRRLISASAAIAEFAWRSTLSPQEALARALQELQGVVKHSGSTRLMSPEDWANETADALNQYATGQLLSTGFADIDKMLGGLEATTVTLMGARLKTGKSTLAWQIAEAAEKVGAVLYASQEMSAPRLGVRHLANTLGISRSRLRTGKVDEWEKTRISRELDRVSQFGRIYVHHQPGATMADVRAKALELAAREGKVALIVEDYLQLLGDKASESSPKHENVTLAFSRLQELAKELNCPVLCVAQLKRPISAASVPTDADFADSDGPARNADALLAMHRPEAGAETTVYLLGSRDSTGGGMYSATLRWQGEGYVNRETQYDERAAA